MGRKLDAREYKLLLDPIIFRPLPTLDAANTFWDERIRQIVQVVDPNARSFEVDNYRLIQFWDTERCHLSSNDLILRTRQKTNRQFVPEDDRKVTLKLRMPDQFIVGTASLARRSDEEEDFVETKFEEDIGPLEVLASPSGGEPRIVKPRKLSTRNRFSLSSSATLTTSGHLNTLGDVFELFPHAAGNISASTEQTGLELRAGSLIHEYVYKGAVVVLDADTEADFTLSIWCFDISSNPPDVAEISFTVPAKDGKMSGDIARKAYNLFNVFQDNLADIIDPNHTSKTSLSLPDSCR